MKVAKGRRRIILSLTGLFDIQFFRVIDAIHMICILEKLSLVVRTYSGEFITGARKTSVGVCMGLRHRSRRQMCMRFLQEDKIRKKYKTEEKYT